MARRKCSFTDSQLGDVVGDLPAQRQAGGQTPRRLAGLDAVAALAGEPEEALDLGVVAHDQVLVGDEASAGLPTCS